MLIVFRYDGIRRVIPIGVPDYKGVKTIRLQGTGRLERFPIMDRLLSLGEVPYDQGAG
jgi:hypothetical protein